MTTIGIVLLVIAVALCLLLIAFIPALVAVRRAAVSVAALSDMVNNELKPTIRELTATISELKTVGNGVAEHTGDVKRFMYALGETGDNLHNINRSINSVTSVLCTTSVWVTGLKVAGNYLLEHYLIKRGGK
jgi:uncharacterized protein YoxC